MRAIQVICGIVAKEFDIPSAIIVGHSREPGVVPARFAAIWIVYDLLKPTMSFPAIARAFGDRDHTTIISAVHRVKSGDWKRPDGWIEKMERARTACIEAIGMEANAISGIADALAEQFMQSFLASVRKAFEAEMTERGYVFLKASRGGEFWSAAISKARNATLAAQAK